MLECQGKWVLTAKLCKTVKRRVAICNLAVQMYRTFTIDCSVLLSPHWAIHFPQGLCLPFSSSRDFKELLRG